MRTVITTLDKRPLKWLNNWEGQSQWTLDSAICGLWLGSSHALGHSGDWGGHHGCRFSGERGPTFQGSRRVRKSWFGTPLCCSPSFPEVSSSPESFLPAVNQGHFPLLKEKAEVFLTESLHLWCQQGREWMGIHLFLLPGGLEARSLFYTWVKPGVRWHPWVLCFTAGPAAEPWWLSMRAGTYLTPSYASLTSFWKWENYSNLPTGFLWGFLWDKTCKGRTASHTVSAQPLFIVIVITKHCASWVVSEGVFGIEIPPGLVEPLDYTLTCWTCQAEGDGTGHVGRSCLEMTVGI